MFGLPLKPLLAILLLVGVGHAGLVHRQARKETLAPTTALDKDNKISLAPQRFDQIPVTIILEPEEELTLAAKAPAPALPLAKAPLESGTPLQTAIAGIELSEKDVQNIKQVEVNDAVSEIPALETVNIITEHSIESQAATEVESLNVSQQQSEIQQQQNEDQSTALITDTAIPFESTNSLKVLASPENVLAEQQKPELAVPEDASPEVSISLQDDLQRQVTQATPTQTSTPQNFVQQLIQNSPIGQFLSQFTGQQQQQQGQVQADEPATPVPTLPGFLNPAAAITSAQQAVQNAAQSVVNTTTQAFQGLQQFATNLGTQFQNTFSTLAGQQSQLSTADSTTTRPPGPIQSIVSNFVNPGNNQGTEGATAAPGQQQQGPLQGILSFFQGGNRPQAANAVTTAAPPKEEPITSAGVDDKIEQQSEQADAILPDQPASEPQPEPEPDTANEVRNSGEVTNDETSFEEVQGEDLIEVNDDATQQDVTA